MKKTSIDSIFKYHAKYYANINSGFYMKKCFPLKN